MLSISAFVFKPWPTIVCGGAACAQPLETWALLPDRLQPGFRIVTRQKALSRPPFANSTVHSTIVHQQRTFWKDPNFQIQLDRGQLLYIFFKVPTRVTTVLQHQRVVEKKETCAENHSRFKLPFLKRYHKRLLMNWSSGIWWKTALSKNHYIFDMLLILCCPTAAKAVLWKRELSHHSK